jgi:hypothetical protein
MNGLSDLDLRLDPWEVDYGTELPLGVPREDPADAKVDPAVERPLAEWAPILPELAAGTLPRLVFVDGVRRVEARVIARRAGRIVHGAFGSYGVGHVEVADGAARLGDAHIDRILVLDSGESAPETVEIGPALAYRPVSVAACDPLAPLARLQEEMRLAEEQRARELAARGDALVVADGPLTFADPARGGALGYVKRLFELYLDPSLLGVLAALPAGARTPLFALRSARRFARYSWFLRLAAAAPGETDLAGLVRLEVADAVGVEAARRLADATASFLPRFAPSRGRDPRAPQNLLPIGALETQLRRRLGDPRLIRRRIAARLAREAAHA